MCGSIRSGVVANSHAGVEIDAKGPGEGIIGVYEAALGAFEVVSCEGVWHPSEAELG